MRDRRVACPCCGYKALIGEFVDEPDSGCCECGASLNEQQDIARSTVEP